MSESISVVYVLYENEILNMFDGVQNLIGIFVSRQSACDFALENGFLVSSEDKYPGFSIVSEELRD